MAAIQVNVIGSASNCTAFSGENHACFWKQPQGNEAEIASAI
jgi:hypothetical protein